jgi:N6-L-threonylcarbamoyladenine synthase
MKILAVDTSCDDTSASVLKDSSILSNIVSSQIEFHKEWGGVVPIIAKRNHEERIDFVIQSALKQARIQIEEIDLFVVTHGPGLAIALEIGVRKIKELATKYNKKVIGVNHMAGHIYANFARNSKGVHYNPDLSEEKIFPLIGLLISGGHTEIIYMKNHLEFEKIGRTLDDSIGEAFDKVSNMMGLGYPGGPIVELLAKQGDKDKYKFPIPMLHSNDLNFSYSGLKTAVLRQVQEIGKVQQSAFDKSDKEITGRITLSKKPTYLLSKKQMQDICASFQKAAAEQLIVKLVKATEQYSVKKVLLGGGVVNNVYVRNQIRTRLSKLGIKTYYPKNKKLLSDNAAMIGIAGYYYAKKGLFSNIEDLDREPSLSL